MGRFVSETNDNFWACEKQCGMEESKKKEKKQVV